MALTPLATAADLPSLWQAHADSGRALLVASAAIRDAAGAAISEETSTVTVSAPSGTLLGLPGPVTAVASVSLDGDALTSDEYEVLSNGLWRRGGWGCAPVPVTVTYTHGLAAVPDDIVAYVCTLAVAWLEHQESGGGSTAGLKSVKIDDAAESYNDEAAGRISPVYIPADDRQWLRARFGGGAVVVETL